MKDHVYFGIRDAISVPTAFGLNYLSEIITNSTGQVYAFTGKADPLVVAGAMARLSRSPDDMRMIILKEFAGTEPEVLDGLFDRVITGYGDDSVQQLMPVMLVVEGCTNLMTKHIEWHRFMAYLEQSTRYIFYDTKVKNLKTGELGYRYYTPAYFSDELKARYRKDMDHIFDLYSVVVRKLTEFVRTSKPFTTDATDEKTKKQHHVAWLGATRAQACDAARAMLPVATISTVAMVGSAQSFDNMVMQLSSLELPEANDIAKDILGESRKVAGSFFKRTDMPARGGAITNYRREIRKDLRKKVSEIAGSQLSYSPANFGVEVNLIDYSPKNEMDVINDLLWSASAASYADVSKLRESLTDEQAGEILGAAIGERFNRRHRPGRSFEFAHFKWEIVCDYGIFRDLQRHRPVDGLEWQELTPYLGYEIPKLVRDAELVKEFEEVFSISSGLHHTLKREGYNLEPQYATLLGHQMRWRVMMNVREAFHFHEIRTGPDGHPGYRKIVQMMHDRFGEVYPQLAKMMKFVNLREDDELTRLAAERATQAKLALLE
jgi:thymidylate synthase ThyX